MSQAGRHESHDRIPDPYGVVACPGCRKAWAVELRHARATCPGCSVKVDLAKSTRLWTGVLPQEAQTAAAALRLRRPGGSARADVASDDVGAAIQRLSQRPAHTLPRHDSPVDAAAAQGTGIRNRSERAEAVASALTCLRGLASHAELLSALEKAGLEPARAEAEVLRMLAADLMMEPRPGQYRFLGGGA